MQVVIFLVAIREAKGNEIPRLDYTLHSSLFCNKFSPLIKLYSVFHCRLFSFISAEYISLDKVQLKAGIPQGPFIRRLIQTRYGKNRKSRSVLRPLLNAKHKWVILSLFFFVRLSTTPSPTPPHSAATRRLTTLQKAFHNGDHNLFAGKNAWDKIDLLYKFNF